MKDVNWGLVSLILSIFPSALVVIGFVLDIPTVVIPLLVVMGLAVMGINLIMIYIIFNGDLKGKGLAHVSLGLLPSPFVIFVAAGYLLK